MCSFQGTLASVLVKKLIPVRGRKQDKMSVLFSVNHSYGKETNPRKGTETVYKPPLLLETHLIPGKETNPRKGTEDEKPLGAFLFYL